jgi:ribonuclease J
MVENAKMAQKLGYLNVPDGMIIPADEALRATPSKVVIMTTGTQGEPSSILGRLSEGRNRQFDLIANDTVVLSSHPIPGNEEMVHRTINRLLQRGARVIYDPIAPVHVSGHASAEEMKLLIHLVKPRNFIPVHGELRHLTQHAAIAREVGLPAENIAVVENGTVLEFEDDRLKIAERIPGGYVYVDGSGVGDIGPSVMREREALAQDGFVVVNLLVNQAGGLVGKPEIISRGFAFVRDSDEMFSAAQAHIAAAVARAAGNGAATSPQALREKVQTALANFFYANLKRRPMIFAFVNEL